jgi:hypothetical protein
MSFLRKLWSRVLLPAAFACLVSVNCTLAVVQKADEVLESEDVDLAKLAAGAKVVLISSGTHGGGFRAIDDDNRTTFKFSSSDPRPTLVVKLIDSRPVHRVSVVVGSAGGKKIDVYLLNDLPRTPADLDAIESVGSIIDPGIARDASIDFSPRLAQYVALRWTLSEGSEGVNLAEMSAFGKGDPTFASAELAASDPPIYVVEGPPIILPVSP